MGPRQAETNLLPDPKKLLAPQRGPHSEVELRSKYMATLLFMFCSGGGGWIVRIHGPYVDNKRMISHVPRVPSEIRGGGGGVEDRIKPPRQNSCREGFCASP